VTHAGTPLAVGRTGTIIALADTRLGTCHVGRGISNNRIGADEQDLSYG